MNAKRFTYSIAVVALGFALVSFIRAEDQPPFLKQALKDTSLGKALDKARIDVSGHIETGVMGNFDSPSDRLNFGRLFDDRANEPTLNQFVFTIERPLAVKDKFDWGFKFQPMIGSDARFTHSLGWFDNMSSERVQFDLFEMYLSAHFPVLTRNGIDVKAGLFATLMGQEVMSAVGNPLYSHSYIFNFGEPFKHSGLMVTTHLTDQIDLCTGLVTGINTFTDDNNDAVSFHGGVSWKSKDGKLSLFGGMHLGPENPRNLVLPTGRSPNSALRIIGNFLVTYKPTDKLTFLTEAINGDDQGFAAEWYGVAQYATYQINNWLGIVGRAEVFRDDDGFAVAAFGSNDDAINVLRTGVAVNPLTRGGGDTTYTELTIGLNIKPRDWLIVRPEIRCDWASDGHKVFDDSTNDRQFTVGVDVIFKF